MICADPKRPPAQISLSSRQILQPPLIELLQQPSNVTWEINPTMVANEAELQQNLRLVIEMAQRFIDSIMYSYHATPGYVN